MVQEPAGERTGAHRAQKLLAAGGVLHAVGAVLGLDCGPMSGFDNAKVDAAFFAGTTVPSNFLCNLGHGDASKLYPRSPRLSFEEACRMV